jgi:hypothetical protein
MIRRPRPQEIELLPQIENAADLRYRLVGLDLVVDMPPHNRAVLELGRRRTCCGWRPRLAPASWGSS